MDQLCSDSEIMGERIVEHLEKLVGFNTVSDKSNTDLIEYVVETLRMNGVEAVTLPDASGKKAGLHATIGPQVAGGVVLSGHSDVVPVTGQTWTNDAFHLTERDGCLHGRGATDMKGFLAVCLAMVPTMQQAPLKRPIHLVFSYDEETTCRGVVPTINDLTARYPRIKGAIVGEPTGMQIVNAHKGAFGYTVEVTGHEAHSSLADQGMSANAMAARLVVWLDEQMQASARKTNGQNGFSPDYTTCHVGTIQGGTACNILAGHCVFEWDLRTMPEDDPKQFLVAFNKKAAEVLANARSIAPDADITIREDYAVPGLKPEIDGVAETLCRRLTGQEGSSVVSYSSEAGQFQAAGLSTVLLGPGSIKQAHIADEYIEKNQLTKCGHFIERLVRDQSV